MTDTEKQALAEGVAAAVTGGFFQHSIHNWDAEVHSDIVRHVLAALEKLDAPRLVSDTDGMRLEEIQQTLHQQAKKWKQGREVDLAGVVPWLLSLVHGLRAALTDALEDRGETQRTQAAVDAAVRAERERIAADMERRAADHEQSGPVARVLDVYAGYLRSNP